MAKNLGRGKIAHLAIDITRQDHVNTAFDQATAFAGGLDAIVNSADIEQQKPTEDPVEQDQREQFAVHVPGTAWKQSIVPLSGDFGKPQGAANLNVLSPATSRSTSLASCSVSMVAVMGW